MQHNGYCISVANLIEEGKNENLYTCMIILDLYRDFTYENLGFRTVLFSR